MAQSNKQHWNKVYSSKPITQLGWYEAYPAVFLDFFEQCSLEKDAPILDVGAWATTFVDHLLAAGYKNIIALDISQVALERLQDRLGEEKAAQVRWIIADITNPALVLEIGEILF